MGTGMHPRHALALALLLALGVLTCAAPAHGSSIVFVRKGNVWLMRPDGSRLRQVTRGGGWSSPSQAYDGTIVALRRRRLNRVSRTGRRLSSIALVGSDVRHSGNFLIGAGPGQAVVSPNGKRVAYWFGSIAQECDPVTLLCDQRLQDNVTYTRANRFTDPRTFGLVRDYRDPAWASNRSLLVFNYGLATTVAVHHPPGGDDPRHLVPWFNDGQGAQLSKGAITRRNDKLAALRGANRTSGRQPVLALYAVSGQAPPIGKCIVTRPAGGYFDHPTWSPDGRALAWEEGDGIHLARRVPDLARPNPNCSFRVRRIARGAQPFWGPKDVRRGDGLRRRR